MRPEKGTLRDHNFKEARAVMTGSASGGTLGEHFDHPGEFTDLFTFVQKISQAVDHNGIVPLCYLKSRKSIPPKAGKSFCF